jgi:hypothetical protein
MSSLLQAAQLAQNDPLSGHLVQAAVALILSLQVWLIKAVTAMRDELRTVRQTLFGVNNDNGIDGTVKDHEQRITGCEGYINRTVPERLKLWDGFKDEVKALLSRNVDRLDKHDHRIKSVEQAQKLTQAALDTLIRKDA